MVRRVTVKRHGAVRSVPDGMLLPLDSSYL